MFSRMRLFVVVLIAAACLTSGAIGANFTFVHVTDTHVTGRGSNVETLASIADEVNALQPAFVLISGDLTETGFPGDWERFAETKKAFKAPVYCVAGNHETKWSNIGKYGVTDYLNLPPRYSFDYGGLHFVGLNSTIRLQHHGQLDKSELTWLAGDLAKAGTRTPSVIFYHHCPGYIPNEAELLRVIRPYNVRLILVGHGHVYKNWHRNGFIFEEGKAAKDGGAYRILEVSETDIRSFTKLISQPAAEESVVSLARPNHPINLIQPRFDDKIDGAINIKAQISGPLAGKKIECILDDQTHPLTPDENGVCETSVTFAGVPGRYDLIVRVTNPDGTEWTDSVPIRINGGSREAWRVKVAGGIQRGIKVAADRAYFGALSGDVYCLDARTGSQIWRTSTGSEVICEVAVHDNLAYFGTADGRVIALDAGSGKLNWEVASKGFVTGSPIVHDGKVLIGTGEPAFFAFDAKTGKELWKTPLGRMTQVVPIVIDDTVYFGAWDANFYALDVKTGQPKWKTSIGPSFYFSTANSDPVTNGRHIVANVTPHQAGDSDIYCLNAKTGEIAWNIRNPGKSDCGFNSPAAKGDRVYSVSGNGDVFCMSIADGKMIWNSSAKRGMTSGKLAIAGDRLYAAGLWGRLVCMNASDGEILWSYSTGNGYLFGGSTVWKDLLIIPSMDGTVTAIKR